MRRTIVYCSFENRFAMGGGLGQVSVLAPRALARSGENVIFVSPYHSEIKACRNALVEGGLKVWGNEVSVNYKGNQIPLTIFEYEEKDVDTPKERRVKCYLIANDEYFKGFLNPYDYDNPRKIVKDSLFFSAAVPELLKEIGITKNIVVHAQDWHTAPLVLSVGNAVLNGILDSAGTVLTLHNLFDSEVTPDEIMTLGNVPVAGDTILQCTIPFMAGKISTVSDVFAEEATSDPMVSTYLAPHLQDYLENGMIGIHNGIFGDPFHDVKDTEIKAGRDNDFSQLMKRKKLSRRIMLEFLDKYEPKGAIGKLTPEPLALLDDSIPVFMAFGRFDMSQKGFDILSQAILSLEKGISKFILCPMGGEDVDFLKRLAEDRDGDVLIYPFRMEKGYREIMKGCSFIVMPSLYEPFGAATEGYLAGTPVVARATGGLLEQVRPFPCGSCGESVKSRVPEVNYTNATGFLFRERDRPFREAWMEWRNLLHSSTLRQRSNLKLFREIVDEASRALQDAINLFRMSERDYSRMIINGFDILDKFSWEAAIERYKALYDTCITPDN